MQFACNNILSTDVFFFDKQGLFKENFGLHRWKHMASVEREPITGAWGRQSPSGVHGVMGNAKHFSV